jgi:hypothetical protein
MIGQSPAGNEMPLMTHRPATLITLLALVASCAAPGAKTADPIAQIRDPKAPDEVSLQRTALNNNRQFVQFFRAQKGLPGKAFRDLPLSIYDEATIRDAWGTPIVFMPSMHRQIGMAPGQEWFFFSAGPDRQFLTRDDNQYSYEALGPGQ